MFSGISFGNCNISAGRALLFLWIAGAICRFSIRTAEYIHLIRITGKCPGYFRHDIESVIDRVNREYGKKGAFKVLLVPGIRTPAIFGLMRPKILMPETDYTERELYYILKHEILHYYQRDMLMKILYESLCTLYWWNPAVFLLKKLNSRMSEIRVDCLLTLGFGEEEKIDYLECIVKSMKAGKRRKTNPMITSIPQEGAAMKQRFGCIWENHWIEKKERSDTSVRKSLALKTLLRSPVKTLLTFFLIAAASFALLSRVTDYAVTGREAANAESFYHGVAALDNTVPDMAVDWSEDGILYHETYETENNPWPSKEQLEEFSSLPGVTMADSRYMTAGLVEGCKRVADESYGDYSMDYFVLEGTYEGYEGWGGNGLYLMFDDIRVLASECELSPGESVRIEHLGVEEFSGGTKNLYSESFWAGLEKGSRVLIIGRYWSVEDAYFTTGYKDGYSDYENTICVLDGAGKDYLDTEEFAYHRQVIDAINRDQDIYDIVYTSDMRSIPRFNERKMVMSGGRLLEAGDTDACVVSELFLETYGMSVGDKINVRLGDKLFSQNPLHGAKSRGIPACISDFSESLEFEIVGSYLFIDTLGTRVSESDWSYSQSTVFVPETLMQVEVPDDYEPSIGEFSVLVEDARDIEPFKNAAGPLAAKMNVALRFSDGGWLGVKNSFEIGTLASLLTTILYATGAALALLLAVYLYVGRNRESYAVMRAMGVPERMAGRSLILPLAALSAIAMPAGGIAGLLYTSKQAAKSLAAIADNALDSYVPDSGLPTHVIIFCLLFELIFAASVTLFFMRKMKKIPPLELLQGGAVRAAGSKAGQGGMEHMPAPAGYDLTKLSAICETELSSRRKYNALRHVSGYVLRHMRRNGWKSVLSLALTAVLVSGVGMLALARLTYKDAFLEVDVNATALDFASSNIVNLSRSDLVKDFYCHNTFSVRTNGLKLNTHMVFTNDIDRYLADDHTVYTATYADGYDISALDGGEPVCMVGSTLAETLGINPGDEIALLSDSRYAALDAVYKGKDELTAAAETESTMYKVIGIIESADETATASIYAGINGPMEDVYSQPFPFGYCECTLCLHVSVEYIFYALILAVTAIICLAPVLSSGYFYRPCY